MSTRLQKKLASQGDDVSTKFLSAAVKGNFRMMERLLKQGHDINASNEVGETAFSWCCHLNKFRSARFLYKHGADINKPLSGGVTPLDVAVCSSSKGFRAWLKSIGGVRMQSYPEWVTCSRYLK